MVMYKRDGNLILVKPMKPDHQEKMCKAYDKIMQQLKDQGVTVTKCILDNDESDEFLNTM